MTTHHRYLGVLGLSQGKGASTSIQRQRESVEAYVHAPDFPGVIVGWAEDTDVSGGLSPFKRPQLGKWLTQRVDVFDGIIAMNVDRLPRRAGAARKLRDIWAGKEVRDRKAILREHGVSIRVWQDLVPRAKYGAVIDFGDITGMARAVGLRPPDGTDRLVINCRCGEGDIIRAGGSLVPPVRA